MAQSVTRAVESGCLAVPDAEDPVRALCSGRGGELAAEHRRRPQFLVHRRPVDHVVFRQQPLAAREFEVVPGQRRPFVSGDENCRVMAVSTIVPDAVEQDAYQGLDAGEIDGAVLAEIAMVQRECVRLLVRGQ
ncbi:hypothetical protein [Streptomyces malaysiensis]|uniref:hypothetical protein n=1 Tax=Streptomyces malaysiensis TaxID=92644 RepID=UPI002B2D63C2|nr:hypothetical protein R8789_00080 [Streptomyces malaysiensis]